MSIEAGSLAVGFADEGALAAPDEAHAYFWGYNVHREFLLLGGDSDSGLTMM
ncbi:hypothetical protein D3C86_2009910 [compost metagenome]